MSGRAFGENLGGPGAAHDLWRSGSRWRAIGDRPLSKTSSAVCPIKRPGPPSPAARTAAPARRVIKGLNGQFLSSDRLSKPEACRESAVQLERLTSHQSSWTPRQSCACDALRLQFLFNRHHNSAKSTSSGAATIILGKTISSVSFGAVLLWSITLAGLGSR